MPDLSWVNARLAVGGAVNADEVAAVATLGISAVIDCQSEFDDTPEFAANPNISVLFNGTPDDGITKPPSWFAKGITFAFAELAQPHAKLLIHCAAGVNRAPSMAYAILRAMGWEPAVAEEMIRSVRPQVGIRYKADADAAVIALGYV